MKDILPNPDLYTPQPFDISEADIMEAMKDFHGYLDITPGDIRELYAFARDFTDRFHHFKEKEKYLLFGLLAQKMDGAIDAEIGLLRGEHER